MLDGVIDYLTPQFVGISDDDGLRRFVERNAFGCGVGMSAPDPPGPRGFKRDRMG